MRVALISSAGRCGIAEHSAQIYDHVPRADAGIEISGNPDWLDPEAFVRDAPERFDLVHLNYHRGLHSRWTPSWVHQISRANGAIGLPFVITFHDTYEVQPDRLPWDLLALDNVKAMVVHEPCDLWLDYANRAKVRYWRQPCPVPTGRGRHVHQDVWAPAGKYWRPTLGTLGFDFPWKNYDLLAEVTAACGWNLRIVGHFPGDAAVVAARQAALQTRNRYVQFDGYVETDDAVAILASCDATAFLYTCGNSGTSGAIRVGIAAGKPLLAATGCRQFRDLEDYQALGLPLQPIQFREPTCDGVRNWLLGYSRNIIPLVDGYDAGLIALAHQESWEKGGRQYAVLYREAVGNVDA